MVEASESIPEQEENWLIEVAKKANRLAKKYNEV